MYCINCGKEIPNGSNYCSFCGTRLNKTSPISLQVLLNHFHNYVREHKVLSITLAIWIFIHLCLYIFSSPRRYNHNVFHDISGGFFPFNGEKTLAFDIDVYDFSELFFYAILLPILVLILHKYCIYGIVYIKNIIFLFFNWCKKHKVASSLSVYVIWLIINLIVYLLSPNELYSPKDFFYPFWGSLYDVINGNYDGVYFSDIGTYDFFEFFVYVLLIPLLFLCIITILLAFKSNWIKDTIRGLFVRGGKLDNRYFYYLNEKNNTKIYKRKEGFKSEESGKMPQTFNWLLIMHFIGDVLICGFILFLCSSIWILWLLIAFGPDSNISNESIYEGCVAVLCIILIINALGHSLILFRYRKKKFPKSLMAIPSVVLELFTICLCLFIHYNEIFEFLDYAIRGMIYLSIVNFFTLIGFLLFPVQSD